MQEIWIPVKGLETRYEVSDLGNVRALFSGCNNRYKAGRLLTPTPYSNGYMRVNLGPAQGPYSDRLLHRLVACAFLPNPEDKPEVNHIDYDRKNNRLDNLEWTTRTENHLHMWKGTARPKKSTDPTIAAAILLREQGMKHEDIAFALECSDALVSLMLNHSSFEEGRQRASLLLRR